MAVCDPCVEALVIQLATNLCHLPLTSFASSGLARTGTRSMRLLFFVANAGCFPLKSFEKPVRTCKRNLSSVTHTAWQRHLCICILVCPGTLTPECRALSKHVLCIWGHCGLSFVRKRIEDTS